jgi:sugar-specific transcriptional regulator TrmB
MPVPGSLKRQPVNKSEIAQLLERQFNLPLLETQAYLAMLERRSVGVDELAETLDLQRDRTRDLLQKMIERGLIIQAPGGSKDSFSALHPRMTMTNIFKIYEKDLVQSLRDRRATVDRVVNLLTPIFEEKKTG